MRISAFQATGTEIVDIVHWAEVGNHSLEVQQLTTDQPRVRVLESGKSWSVIARDDVPGWEAELRDQGHRRGFVIRIRRTDHPPSRTIRTAPGVLRKEARELAARAIQDVAAVSAGLESPMLPGFEPRVLRVSLKGAKCVVLASAGSNTTWLERSIRDFGWLPSRTDISPRLGTVATRSLESASTIRII